MVNDLADRYRQYEYKPHVMSYPDRKYELRYFSRPMLNFLDMVTNGQFAFAAPNQRIECKKIHKYANLMHFFYNELDDNERVRFLGFYTIDPHELTHHIDFMTTPFGTNFHCKALQEYLIFQQFASELLKNPKIINNRMRLLDFDSVVSAKSNKVSNKLNEKWKLLKKKILFSDAYFRIGKDIVSSSTYSKIHNLSKIDKYFRILGENHEIVIVNEFMITIKIPGDHNHYLRPITILETRALAHSLRWILDQLGNNELALMQLVNYLKTFYTHELISPDYDFVLGLFLNKIGKINLTNYAGLEKVNPKGISLFLYLISWFCWYALQAPPLVDSRSSLAASSPVFRFLLALRYFLDENLDFCRRLLYEESDLTNVFSTITSFFSNLDLHFRNEIINNENVGLLPVDKCMNDSLKMVNYMQDLLLKSVMPAEIKKHFGDILRIQRYQLTKRIDNGYYYYFPIGLPPSGNPLYHFRDVDANYVMLTPDLRPVSNSILMWFKFREDFIFTKILPGQRIKDELQKYT
jgi:hypothetical protein